MKYQVQINDKAKAFKARIKQLEKERTQIKKDKELSSETSNHLISKINAEISEMRDLLPFLERKGLKLVKLSNGDIYDMALIQAYCSKLGAIKYTVYVSEGSLVIKMDNQKGQMVLQKLNAYYEEFDVPAIDERKELNAVEDYIC